MPEQSAVFLGLQDEFWSLAVTKRSCMHPEIILCTEGLVFYLIWHLMKSISCTGLFGSIKLDRADGCQMFQNFMTKDFLFLFVSLSFDSTLCNANETQRKYE